MNTRTRLLAALAWSLFGSATLWSQADTTRNYTALRFGGGVLYSTYSADFSTSGQIVDCGAATRAADLGFTVDATLEIPLSSRLALGAGLSVTNRRALFPATNTYPMRDTAGQEWTLTTDVDLAGSLSYLELQPDIRYVLAGDYERRWLGLIGGLRLALPLRTTYEQTERVVSPDDGYLIVNGLRTRERLIGSGPLTARSSLLLGATIGLESILPLSQRWALVPRLQYDHYFNSILTDATWNVSGIRMSIELRRVFSPAPAPPPPPPPLR